MIWGAIYLCNETELSTQVLGMSEGRHHVAWRTKHLIGLGGWS